MPQSEILPQSVVDTKTIVLKARLDYGDIQLIEKEIGPRVFSKFGFKPKPEDVKLLHCENYFEPYLIIEGKYALDYCKRHVFKVDVNERTNKLFVGGQEFNSELSDAKATKKIIKLMGEEYSHYDIQTYFILDRMKREISPEKLPIAPFYVQKEGSKDKSNFKQIYMPDEAQIEFLKAKIAKRPADVAQIIREKFDITERTIVYCPMYGLTFENVKNQKVATITINGITGEIILNGIQKIAYKTIVTFPKNEESKSVGTERYQFEQPQTVHNISLSEPPENMDDTSEEHVNNRPISPISEENNILGFPAKINGDIFVESDDAIAVVGDVEVPADTIMDKSLIVKGSLIIGDCCVAHGKLKALKDVTIGADAIVEGDLLSGGNILVGPRSVITGTLKATGAIKICGEATIEGGLRANPKSEVASDAKFEVNMQ
jgi:hypothetical protein